ncbi:MAG: hypothetical protein ABI759_04480 [Candidatus Solibacter sp.]
MDCPLQSREGAQLLLERCTGGAHAAPAGDLVRHIAECAVCRAFTEQQRSVWEAMDTWEAAPVSADFDQRLYRRIAAQTSWWERLLLPLRQASFGRSIPAAAMAGLLVMAGIVLVRPGVSPVAPPARAVEHAQGETLQPEQVEYTLDSMEVLEEFSQRVRPDAPESKL